MRDSTTIIDAAILIAAMLLLPQAILIAACTCTPPAILIAAHAPSTDQPLMQHFRSKRSVVCNAHSCYMANSHDNFLAQCAAFITLVQEPTEPDAGACGAWPIYE